MESIKAPFEFVSASFRRSQKQLSFEMKDIVLKLGSLQNKSEKEAQEVFVDVEKRISSLLTVLDNADVAEKENLGKMMARCQEYQTFNGTPPLGILSPPLLSDRKELALIGEFLLRRGHLEAVDALIEESGGWLDDLLDVKIYKSALGVETSVLKGDMDAALQWVQDHASKLRRLNSALEFFVRQEQFLTLVYRGQSLDALRFAQTYLAPLVADKPPAVTGSESSAQAPPSSSRDKKRDKRSSSITSEGSEDSFMISATNTGSTTDSRESPSRTAPASQRPRAVSLGTAPLPSSSTATSRRFSRYLTGGGGSRGSRSAYVHSTPPRHTPPSNTSTGDNSLPISLPFSFSANPLAFFRYSRVSAQSQPARERSSSGNFVEFLSGDATFRPPEEASASTSGNDNVTAEQEQSMYMKEAMCHLMSMLAFMSPSDQHLDQGQSDKQQWSSMTNEKDSSSSPVSKKCKNSITSTPSTASPTISSSSVFNGSNRSMVPCLYDELYTPHRRRCIVDLFRVECRRVYGLRQHSSELEQLVALGMFVLRTPACGGSGGGGGGGEGGGSRGHVQSPQRRGRASEANSPSGIIRGASGSGSGSSVLMATALRYMREGIRTARNRARSGSSGSASSMHSSSGSGADDMDVVEEIEDAVPMSEDWDRKSGRNVDQQQLSSPPSPFWPQCPVCSPAGQIIANSMPKGVFAARAESVLVCRGSGRVMNHDNPPVALPNGQVYSKSFVMSQARPKDVKIETTSPLSSSNSSNHGMSETKSALMDRNRTPVQSVGPLSVSLAAPSVSTSPSLFAGGCCHLRTDASSPRSSSSCCSSNSMGYQQDELEEQDQEEQKVHDEEQHDVQDSLGVLMKTDGGRGRPWTAIETMRRLRRRSHNTDSNIDTKTGWQQSDVPDLLASLAANLKEEEQKGKGEGEGEYISSASPPPLFFTCPVTGSCVDVSLLRAVFIV